MNTFLKIYFKEEMLLGSSFSNEKKKSYILIHDILNCFHYIIIGD